MPRSPACARWATLTPDGISPRDATFCSTTQSLPPTSSPTLHRAHPGFIRPLPERCCTPSIRPLAMPGSAGSAFWPPPCWPPIFCGAPCRRRVSPPPYCWRLPCLRWPTASRRAPTCSLRYFSRSSLPNCGDSIAMRPRAFGCCPPPCCSGSIFIPDSSLALDW